MSLAQEAVPKKEMLTRSKQAKRVLRQLRKSPLAVGGISIVACVFLVALVGPLIAPYNPIKVDFSTQFLGPSAAHWFGTDESGRDILSRAIYGTRISIETAAVILSIAVSVGIIMGSIAGWSSGWLDNLVMRITDMFLAFPALILALAFAASLGPGLTNAMLAISTVWWPWYARMARAQVLSLKQQLYVEAARSIGARDLRIIVRHVLPNALSPIVVMMTMDIGFTILTAAALSFLGLGAQPPTPELGAMISTGRLYILDYWWVPTFPGLVIFVMVLGTNLFGDALRDVLDPQQRSVVR
ncbi:MAG: ABC transporter permease [Chloroflexi bacterium]|nr:ABC transporter permease [Chloroflexota bacterium]